MMALDTAGRRTCGDNDSITSGYKVPWPEFYAFYLGGFFFKDFDKFIADNLSFSSGRLYHQGALKTAYFYLRNLSLNGRYYGIPFYLFRFIFS